MNCKTTFRITINGSEGSRQYHLYSRWVVDVYVQTYLKLGKQVRLEQLIDGLWQPSSI